jgi:hypothetical protein
MMEYLVVLILYPNPNKGTIYLDINADYTDLNVRISNTSGQIVLTKAITKQII